MLSKVLVLNQNYEPMSVCSVQKAIVLVYLGKAETVEVQHGRYMRSVTRAVPMPSIVRLFVYIRVPYRVILSRKNILRRDNFHCQYCGNIGVPLTIDHIVPRSKHGEETWENLVAACVKCNNKKGDRTPDEAKMPLLRKPMRPNHVFFIRHFVGAMDERWKPYLFMH